MPYLILRSSQTVNSEFVHSMTNTERTVYKTFQRTYWLNCATNPFIYCACAQEFRKECKEIWPTIFSVEKDRIVGREDKETLILKVVNVIYRECVSCKLIFLFKICDIVII